MDENLVNLSQFQIRFCFFEEISRAELSAFQRVRRGLVYLSGESRPSLAGKALQAIDRLSAKPGQRNGIGPACLSGK